MLGLVQTTRKNWRPPKPPKSSRPHVTKNQSLLTFRTTHIHPLKAATRPVVLASHGGFPGTWGRGVVPWPATTRLPGQPSRDASYPAALTLRWTCCSNLWPCISNLF